MVWYQKSGKIERKHNKVGQASAANARWLRQPSKGARGRVWMWFAASWGGGALAKSPMQNRSQPNPKNQQTGTKWTPTRQSGTRRATTRHWGGLPCPGGCWGATVSAVRLHLCGNAASCYPRNHAPARKHTRSDSPKAPEAARETGMNRDEMADKMVAKPPAG